MESGSIVEFIDHQKIMCAVILEVKNSRLRLLTENNREVKLSVSRLLHKDKVRLDLSLGRDQMVHALKGVVSKRKELLNQVDIKDLWEVLNAEQVWIDLATMTAFCFPGSPCGDHESAVLRAFFDDRLYFKFSGIYPIYLIRRRSGIHEVHQPVSAGFDNPFSAGLFPALGN